MVKVLDSVVICLLAINFNVYKYVFFCHDFLQEDMIVALQVYVEP